MPRYALSADCRVFDTVEADSAAAALADVDPSEGYDTSEGPVWVDCHAVNVTDPDDCASRTVLLNQTEPDCTESEHDWQSPIEIVGGIAENPGVFGHGGGVIIKEFCTHCGCARVTDTWAQNPEDGTQGWRTVTYDPDLFADQLAALADDDSGEEDSDD